VLDGYTNIHILVYVDGGSLKPLRWAGSSLKDLKSFPSEVRSVVGYALYAAQNGDRDPAAKPLKGFGGASVMEILALSLATHGALSTPSVFKALFTCSTPFRRNPNLGHPLRRKKST
jgi:hypothetical protein